MYIVTGGAGFIGSFTLKKLNERGIEDIIVVDSLKSSEKWKNLRGKKFKDYLDKGELFSAIEARKLDKTTHIIHLGASSSTTVMDCDYLMENNVHYSQRLGEFAKRVGARMVYASSAATYGAGELGYEDIYEPLVELKPLNPYGYSKHLVDLWFQRHIPNTFAGLKFFNVYGPNEYHKGGQKSVVNHAYHQILNSGEVKLFKSYRDDYGHGEQKRDFVYVDDCVDVMLWLLERPQVNGLFNVGTGQARSWNDLANAIFAALDKPSNIKYIEMPDNLINQYQYFTQANVARLRSAGYDKPFTSLEDGVRDYVIKYLEAGTKNGYDASFA